MLKIVNSKHPLNLIENFTALQDVRSYLTRQTISSFSFLPFLSDSLAQNQLAFRGTKAWSLT